MNRRSFVHRAGILAASAALADLPFRPARAAGCSRPAGVQLYTVRDALQRDPLSTLAELGKIGIREGELYGLNGTEDGKLFGLPLAELERALDANGISVPMSHIGGELTNTAEIADLAHALGTSALVIAVPSEFRGTRDGRPAMIGAQSRGQLDALAEKLNRAGREYGSHGLTFGYHNHNVEFMPLDDIVPYEYLMANTDPDLVKIELDVGWLAVAGIDPVEYLRKYAGRVIACHLKDYDPDIAAGIVQRKLVPPGAGRIDFAAVLAAMDSAGVGHGFIEVDVSDDPMRDVARGQAHIAELEGCR